MAQHLIRILADSLGAQLGQIRASGAKPIDFAMSPLLPVKARVNHAKYCRLWVADHACISHAPYAEMTEGQFKENRGHAKLILARQLAFAPHMSMYWAC